MQACERLVQATHLHDRYPVYLGDSARSFLRHPGSLGATDRTPLIALWGNA